MVVLRRFISTAKSGWFDTGAGDADTARVKSESTEVGAVAGEHMVATGASRMLCDQSLSSECDGFTCPCFSANV